MPEHSKFQIICSKDNPNEYSLIISPEEKYKVMLSEDLFESHTCTCKSHKSGENCLHIDIILEEIKNNTGEKVFLKENIVYLDVETQFSSEDVGGWGNIAQMKLAIAVIYCNIEDRFEHYTEETIMPLIDKLSQADLVVGFNIKHFDYTVLQPYISGFNLSTLPTLDMLQEIYKKLGHRVSLNDLAAATLNVGKSADGLQSVEWFKRGELEKIIDYCKKDVAITRDLFLFGRKYGHVKFLDKRNNKIKKVNVSW